MNTPSIADAGNNTNNIGTDDLTEELLKDWDATRPSDDNPDEDVTEETEDTSEDAEELSEEGDEGSEDQDQDEGEAPAPKTADPDAVVKVKVDGKELDVKVSDLTRLYGQEASLTKKSQEVAAVRKRLEDDGIKYVAATEVLIRNAYERYKPFENIDWKVAERKLDADEYKALWDQSRRAYQDIQFLTAEVDGHIKHVQAQRHQELEKEAREALAELEDPVKGIPGFGKELYGEIYEFALDQNVPKEVIDTMTAPWAVRLLHKAMLYERGKKAATTKVTKTPNKVVKSRTSAETTRNATKKPASDADRRFRQSGSIEDLAASLLQDWRNKD